MNRTSIMAAGWLWGALAWALLVATARGAGAETNTFGFTGPEIYPMDNAVTLLHAADMDGDGLNDLIVVNNARAKINILYNRTGKTNIPPADDGLKKEINQLPPDARFRITSIASEKRISSLVVADLNGDGRPDLAYYGDPKELVVLYNLGTNGWSAPKRFAIDDGQLGANALTTGDLHGSGRPGLVLLGENNLYYIAQNADHLLAEPEKIPFSGAVKSLQVLDINGDGRDDLLLINWDSPDPFRFRLQDAQGQLGPEVHFTFPSVRSYLADDLLGDHKMELITIAQNSGRAQISGLNRKPAEPLSGAFKSGQFQVLPLKKTTQARRGILWADVNGRRPLRSAGGRAGQRPVDPLSATGRRQPRPGQDLPDLDRRDRTGRQRLEPGRHAGDFRVEQRGASDRRHPAGQERAHRLSHHSAF